MVFWLYVNMGNNSDLSSIVTKERNVGKNNFYRTRNHNFMYYLFTVCKKDMAEAKIGWILFQLLGWPVTIFSFLADVPGINIGEPYRTIMALFGIVFMCMNVLRAREKWRKEKMENDDKQKEINRKWDEFSHRVKNK